MTKNQDKDYKRKLIVEAFGGGLITNEAYLFSHAARFIRLIENLEVEHREIER